MAQDIRTISILDTTSISTKEVIMYLEKMNSANSSILNVLKRKPALPGYSKLPWVMNLQLDIEITNKLRQRKQLNVSEKARLTETLKDALKELRKLRRNSNSKDSVVSLEQYIEQWSNIG